MNEKKGIFIWYSKDHFDGPGWVLGYTGDDGETEIECLDVVDKNGLEKAIQDAYDFLQTLDMGGVDWTEGARIRPFEAGGKKYYQIIPKDLIMTKRLHTDGGGFKVHIDKAIVEKLGLQYGDMVQISIRRA